VHNRAKVGEVVLSVACERPGHETASRRRPGDEKSVHASTSAPLSAVARTCPNGVRMNAQHMRIMSKRTHRCIGQHALERHQQHDVWLGVHPIAPEPGPDHDTVDFALKARVRLHSETNARRTLLTLRLLRWKKDAWRCVASRASACRSRLRVSGMVLCGASAGKGMTGECCTSASEREHVVHR
jgi:hypothetical protein